MATTTGLTAEQLQAKIDELKRQGKTESTSKSLGKYVDALKVLQPEKYGAETVQFAQNKLASSTQVPGVDGSFGGLGGTGMGGNASGVPDLNSIYNAGLGEANALELELKKRRQALVDAQTNINDNPFYSEATRVGKLSKLEQQAQAEISNLENEVASKKADAQIRVNIANQQYGLNQQAHQQAISDLNNLIATGAIAGIGGTDLAKLAIKTGLSTSQIKAIQQKYASDQVKSQVITNTDNNGNVTVSVIDTATGKTISQSSLGSVGAAKTDGSGGGSKTPETNRYLTQATKLLSSADAMNAGDEDKLLSREEQTAAYNKILALVGGNTSLAQQVFQQAWEVGGYDNYGS
jgi:hypothetical protein